MIWNVYKNYRVFYLGYPEKNYYKKFFNYYKNKKV